MSAWLGLLPAFAYLVAGGVLGLSASPTAATAQGLAFTENPVRLIVYGATYVWALAWLLRDTRALGGVATRLWPLWLLLAYALASTFWSAVPMKVFIDTGHLGGVALVALAASLAARGNPGVIAKLCMGAGTLVIVVSIVAIRLGLPGTIDAESARWAGTTGNANTLGLYCAMVIGAGAFVFLSSTSTAGRVLTAVSALLAAFALHRCGSMTSMVVAAFWVLTTGWLTVGRSWWRAGPIGRTAVGALLVAVVAVIAAAFVPQVLDPQFGWHLLGRSADFTGRTELWAFGWDYFTHEPLRGFGFDSLASILSASNTTVGQLHNGYLDLLLRGGAIAGCIFLIFTVRALMRSFAVAKGVAGAPWFAVIIGAVLLHNWTESSILRPVHPLWLMFLLACTAVYVGAAAGAAAPELIANDRRLDRTARPAALPNLLR